jgi:hypothetical protein
MSRARAAGVLIALAAVLAPMPVASAAPVELTGAVLWADDFNGTPGHAPNPANWADYSTCTYNSSAAFGSIKCGNNEYLDGAGSLVVPATPTAGSAIRTVPARTWQYGVFSAWITMPSQVGYWPAFWTLNNNWNGVDSLPVGEADIAEHYTTWPTLYHATLHNWTGNSTTNSGGDTVCGGPNLSAGQHKYTVRIEPGKVSFYFDNVPCGPTYTPTAGKPWAFGPDVARPNWLILDLAIGGAGGQQAAPTANAQMLVGRVEVRAL